MSWDQAPLPPGGNGLLRGSRTRSYGSLVRSPLSPVSQRRIEHNIQPGETLQGLALKYGVSMEQIKRANRLYTNDSIFLKKSLSIPVLSDCCNDGVDLLKEDGNEGSADWQTGSSSERNQNEDKERMSDLTPVDYLKRLDGLISQSKQAAVKRCQETEKRVAAVEAACTSRAPDSRPLMRSVTLCSRGKLQQASQVAVPLTITKLTKKLQDREDEIFQL